MFINCPHCQALIATDPATDLPPPKCPRCAASLRGKVDAAADAPSSIATQSDTAMHATPADGDAAVTPPAAPALPQVEPLDAKPAQEPDGAAGQARADLPTAIAAVISPIAALLEERAPRTPAEPRAAARQAPAPEPAPEDGTAAPPASESTTVAMPTAAEGTTDAAPPAQENTIAPATTDASPAMHATANAPIDPATATTTATDAPASAGDAAGASQTADAPVDAPPGNPTAESTSAGAATDEPARTASAEPANGPAGAPSTGPAHEPSTTPSTASATARADAPSTRPADAPAGSRAEPEAQLPTGPEAPPAANEPATVEAAEPAIAEAAAPPPSPATADVAAVPAATVESAPRPATATATATATPSFARTGILPHHGFDWRTATAAAALALLLLLQLLLAGRAQLADDARWRPLVSTLCSVSGCTLPPWREPAAFTVLARDVRPHPSLPGVLRVTATLRNDAQWSQPWPRLRLTLSDVDGNPVAARDFAASEYLGARSSPQQIASGQVAAFAMDIVEPAPRSVAFDFELH